MKLLELGKHYVSDFVKDNFVARDKYSLDLVLDKDIGAVRLAEVAPASTMWGKYWYRSGTNYSMMGELKSIVDEILQRVKKPKVWLDIACNDGTLLSYVPKEIERIGVDPADDSFLEESSKHGTIIQSYFNANVYQFERADVVTTIAMFYDLDDPHPFIEDVKTSMHDNGIWVLQLSYTPLMLQQLAFDNICHEHRYYYCLRSMINLLGMHGMKIVDCQLNDVNGASFRIYVQKCGAKEDSFATRQMRYVCDYRTEALLRNEVDLTDIRIWQKFYSNICDLRWQTVSFIRSEKAKGKRIYAYGASTKGNTLLQWFGLDSSLIEAIAERSPYKYGLRTIGTDIPIVSEEVARAAKPDYMLVLPWHFIKEFVAREQPFLQGGGRFIVPCPEFKII